MKLSFFPLLFVLLTFCSCKEEYSFEFVVVNESDRSAFVIVQRPDILAVDTNLISPGQSLIVGVSSLDARNAEKAAEDVLVPFDDLIIEDQMGNAVNNCDGNLTSVSCWGIRVDDKKDELTEANLRIREGSFE